MRYLMRYPFDYLRPEGGLQGPSRPPKLQIRLNFRKIRKCLFERLTGVRVPSATR